jgi:hypothetical protein
MMLRRINLGKKQEKPQEISSSNENRIIYPTFCIYDKKLPIESDDVGKIFTCQVKMDFVGIRENTDKKKSSYSYDFEIREIVFGDKTNETSSEKFEK